MRILRYYPRAFSGDGGITNSVRRHAEASVRAGATVSVAVDEPRVPSGADGGFSWLAVRHEGPAGLRWPVGLAEHLRDVDLLVLHSAWTLHNIRAARVARGLGVPYVLEPRGAYDPRIFARRRRVKSLWWWSMERAHVQRAAAVHLFFDSELDHLRRIGYRGATLIAPNGITPPPGVAWDGGSGGYVLWIGRFDPEHKGLDLLLEAYRRLPADGRPPLRLHGPDWVGGKARVARLVTELGLAPHVHLGEPVYGDEKWRLLSRALAFTYPSRWEGFGNSAAEAVSIGVPTLVTPYPFGRWLADRGGAVLAEANPEDLAEGLRTVVAPSAADVGHAGRDVVGRHLSWDAVARSWLEQAAHLV